jgi:hypothetical protein
MNNIEIYHICVGTRHSEMQGRLIKRVGGTE